MFFRFPTYMLATKLKILFISSTFTAFLIILNHEVKKNYLREGKAVETMKHTESIDQAYSESKLKKSFILVNSQGSQ